VKAVFAWVKTNWLTSVIAAAVLLALLWYVSGSIGQWWGEKAIQRDDQRIQQDVDRKERDSQASERNANTAGTDRQAAEARAAAAEQQKQQAAANSNRTADPVRKARQRYEETRRSHPADSPTLGDDQLCAELARRNIGCR
jgi:hypothetical protein